MADRKRATNLLIALRDGDRGALDQLMPLVYEELRAIARRKLLRAWLGRELEPT